jgi:putative flippase GtrA
MLTLWRDTKLLKFLLVGVLNTAFGYSVFIICLWAGLHYSAAIAFATVLGTLFNFKSIGALVFRSHDNSRLFRFVGVYCVVYVVNVLGVGILLRFGVVEWLGGLILLLPLALLSYSLNSRYVFQP